MAYDRKALLRNILVFLLVFIIGVGIGAVAGYFGRQIPAEVSKPSELLATPTIPTADPNQLNSKINRDADPRISDILLNEVNADQIRQHLKDYASSPHLAGTPADLEQAKQLKQQWLDQGLDHVDILSYDVLLSYPKDGDPNLVSLFTANNTQIFESQRVEQILRPEDVKATDDVVPPFNAYSPPGDVTSQKLFYVNYGREEDFYWLKNNKSIDFNDSVVIARYGKIFRGDIVEHAAEYHAKAVILYTDPIDYTLPTDNSSYPNSWWLPGTGVQRGTVKTGDSDPLTPFYPALDSAYRISNPKLPTIPAHPISYDDAKHLLQQLQGDTVPDEWKGSIPGLEYKFGGSFADSNMTIKVHITTTDQRRHTYNVVGYINGAVEPDRYVMVGNHRDAWVYGAVDPSSGTAAMVETSRAITSVMKAYNWRPRRTIIFCSWGAEEHGLLGSTEFTEHFSKVIGQRAVAYLNVDTLIEGMDYMTIFSSPMLYTAVYNAAKKIPNPDSKEVAAGRTTVYDTWLHLNPSDENPSLPKIEAIGSGSDYSSFQNTLGIPCLDPHYKYDTNKWKTISYYPLYHTVYETFYLMDQIMDPGFKLSRAVTQVWAELIRDISDSLILPLDAQTFSNYISVESQKLLNVYEGLMRANNLTADVDYFKEAIQMFQNETDKFTQELSAVDKSNPYKVREMNDKLMNLLRSFLDPQGLPGREMFKNLLLAPSVFDAYAGTVFPTLVDSLHRIETNADPDKWEKVKKNMSIVTYIIHTAASTLRKSSEFTKV